MAKVRVLRSGGPGDRLQGLRTAAVVAMVLFALLLIQGLYFKVSADEVAVVTRFGAYDRTVEPGLHFKLPLVERAQKVEIRRAYQEDFGFRSESTRRLRPESLAEEALMLTGDLNAAEVQWIVRYRISDPRAYLFNIQEPIDTLRDLSESVMRTVVGDRSVYEVLTVGRSEVNAEVQLKLQESLDSYTVGITVDLVQLQTVGPPDERVKAAFNKVNQSEQEKERKINEANQEYNQKVPLARGEAEKTVQEAEGYKIDRINRARGETARFLSLLTEYEKAPDVTRRRIYLETMAEVLPNLGSKVIIDEDVPSALPLLHLGTEAEDGR